MCSSRPSMRFTVKPPQAFFLAARTARAAGLVPIPSRLLLSSRAFFPRRRPPLTRGGGRAAAGKECSSTSSPRGAPGRAALAKALPVDWRASRSGRRARTTVYPWGTCHGPQHLMPCTRRASGTPAGRAHPSNERCLYRITRRHNGGSHRPHFPHRPRAATRLSSFSECCCRCYGNAASHGRRGRLRVPPCRRIHPQPPILLLGPFRQLPPVQVTPQGDQQLPRQGHDPHFPGPLVPRAEAALVPLAQRTPGLPAQPQPRQLHDQATHVLVARLADPLLPLTLAAVVGCRRQADQCPQLLAV